ncbi:DUF3857 domain-containing protein [Galbibacter sp. EGI 63066]|uniref:DUF3857 domain-containing protein n=1 Tax=Galbibacter sp. EGI 63066 TaxID=2993559 RepID=UPI002248B521|nr:DUF3857 domain-containing protein [Galbibacter sp. EGI 63066]MCX2681388.1 DUF3857 domain-containing protein [Galbibacter sp. EGI 63066]
MLKHLLYLLLIISLHFSVNAQDKMEIDNVTDEELNMKTYKKDTTAHAVVLYEEGKNYFVVKTRRILLVKEYYCKIKILDEEGFDHANIEIPFYHNDKRTEKIKDIKAMTHNDKQKIVVNPNNMYKTDINERWSSYRFTFSNVKEGSVLEYKYTLETPFYFNFEGWDFQTSIPKVKSVFKAEIPGNYKYNRTLMGAQELSINEADIKRDCFYIDGYPDAADCEVLTYIMEDIPAFKEEEYMLSKKNYMSRLKFELSEFYGYDGIRHQYTKSWESVDKELRSDKYIGKQLKKVNYFEKVLPSEILSEKDELSRAKKVYSFIQKHFNWNGDYGLFSNSKIKKAYEEGSGDVSDINLSLINALKAAGLNAKLVLLSTRDNGLPTKQHPVISDFNYTIAMVEIGKGVAMLDASEKYTPFGILPFRTLNHIGRVMDFKNDSYWVSIVPFQNNYNQMHVEAKITDSGTIEGRVMIKDMGYLFYEKSEQINTINREKYIEDLENQYINLHISDYKSVEKENSVVETFSFEVDNIENVIADNVYLSPFIFKITTSNPFQLKERDYPIDIGYPKKYNTQISLTIPDGFQFISVPDKKNTILEDNGGRLSLMTGIKEKTLNLLYTFELNKSYYKTSEYENLKSFFKDAVEIQNSESVVIKKNKT